MSNLGKLWASLARAGHMVEEGFVRASDKAGLYRADAAIAALFPISLMDAFDKTGLSANNFIDRHNERHPECLIVSPYKNRLDGAAKAEDPASRPPRASGLGPDDKPPRAGASHGADGPPRQEI